MPVSKAQMKAKQKFEKNKYDSLRIRVYKGEKDIIKAHAAYAGESLNGFVTRAIIEAMLNDDKAALEEKYGKHFSELSADFAINEHLLKTGETITNFVERAIIETLNNDRKKLHSV